MKSAMYLHTDQLAYAVYPLLSGRWALYQNGELKSVHPTALEARNQVGDGLWASAQADATNRDFWFPG